MLHSPVAYAIAGLLSVSLGHVCAADIPGLPQGSKAQPASASVPAFVRPKAVESGNRAKKSGEELECLIEPRLVVNVGSPVEGTLSKVFVDRGSVVSAGQIVAQLNSNVETATVDLKRAQEEFGKRKVERNEELFKKDLISAMDRDELATQARIAALERRQQEEVLAQRTIRSPITGVVVERYLAPGDRVQQEKILKLAQVDPLNVEVVAPVEMFGSIKVGMSGVVSLEPLLKGRYAARVVIVDKVVDAASGTFGVRLELPNRGNLIPAGIKCGVTIGH
jgi:membrane fusion protein, multidrug efflux system